MNFNFLCEHETSKYTWIKLVEKERQHPIPPFNLLPSNKRELFEVVAMHMEKTLHLLK